MEYGDKPSSNATKCSTTATDTKVTDPRWLLAQPLLALLPSVSMSNQQPQQFLMQPDGSPAGAIPLQYLQAGMNFNLLTQLQQQAAGQQFAHNSQPTTTASGAATGESPVAPQTPGSNSLGSPPTHPGGDATTPRSGTPATPSQTPSNLELQMQQLIQNQPPGQEQSKSELAKSLKPPKKPLTPYMRFSKTVWPQVKEQNATLSVCEIGAAIGKMWREEITEEEKSRYNNDFNADKARYEAELQEYMRVTGLQLSDIVKPRGRKKKAAQQEVEHHAAQPTVKFDDGELQLQKYLRLSGLPGAADGNKPAQASPRGRGPSKKKGGEQVGALPLVGATQQMSPVQLQQLLLQQQQAAVSQAANGQAAYQDAQGLPNITQLFPGVDGTGQTNDTVALSAYLAMIQNQPTGQAAGQGQQQAGEAGDNWNNWQFQRAGERPQSRQQEADRARDGHKQEQEVNGDTPTSAQLPSSHTLYNTYAYNPWSAYPSQGPALNKGTEGREEALERELKQVKLEMNSAMEELEKTRRENRRLQQNVENLQQQNAALSNSLNLFSQQLQQQEDRKPQLNHDD